MSAVNVESKGKGKRQPPGKSWRGVLLEAGQSYIRGLLALIIAYGLWRAIEAVPAWLEQHDVQPTPTLLLAILVVPLVLGWVIWRVLYPWARRVRLFRAVLRGEERFFAEFAPDSRRGFPVALVSWPNERIRSFGVVTATYPGPEPGHELATVFLPGGPNVRRGRLWCVPVNELEFIDWNLTECLRLHLSYGTHSPGALHKRG